MCSQQQDTLHTLHHKKVLVLVNSSPYRPPTFSIPFFLHSSTSTFHILPTNNLTLSHHPRHLTKNKSIQKKNQTMDFVNKLTNSEKNKQVHTQTGSTGGTTSGGGGGLMDKLHGMAGGGQQSEKNEDALDKGIVT